MALKRLAIVKHGRRYSRAVLVQMRNGLEWAKLPDSNLALFPGAYEEDEVYEVGSEFDQVDALALSLTDKAKRASDLSERMGPR